MRRLAGALLALFFSTAPLATTVTTDYSDIWWNPDESGWGANLIQQGDTLFVTLFVYDGNRNPVWFVAPSTAFDGAAQFSGPLLSTAGPSYFSTFDPALVTDSQVGTFTFTPLSASTARIVYTIGAFNITKNVTRQTWRDENLAGFYLGARQGTWSGCGAALNGRVDSFASVGVTQQGENVQIHDAGNRYTCNYVGKYRQTGRFGELIGSGVCDDGVNRFLTGTEIQVSPLSFAMRYRMQQLGTDCTFDGYVGGIRQVP
jgi:hypothetical protein